MMKRTTGIRIALTFVLGAVCLIAVLHITGCVTINSYAHRGQITNFSTNCIPETVNIENMHEGGTANIEDVTGAKLK